jgi:IPT/TIG domain
MLKSKSPWVCAAGIILFTGLSAGCAGGVSSSKQPGTTPPPPTGVSVSVSPATANVRAGDSYPFSAIVTGAQNTGVLWAVNGTAGGSAATGTIDSTGNFTAPATLPSPNPVKVRATSLADASASGSGSVTILNPTPVLIGINPASVSTGNFTLTVTGSKFVSGAQVFLGATPLQTTFNSSTQLTAMGNVASPGGYPVSVRNPDPGSSASSSVNLQVTGSTQAASCSGMSLGQGASLNGYRAFPDDNLWNKDISGSPVDPNSSAIINFIGPGVGIHADFGAGQYQGSTIGIPYTVVGAQQQSLNVSYTAYGGESDPGPMPIPIAAPIEGYPNPGTGDRHVLVLDNANCFLYELFSSYPQANNWNAGSGAVWDLQADEQRPYGWTSADAAGLPIFPGLIRYDEVATGQIRHAIRFTLAQSRAAFTPPASHWAANSSNPDAAPMGMTLRLKASFDISAFSATNQVILAAMKKYGMIMADNGSSMFISGAPDDRWDNNDLHILGNVIASDFEVVQMSSVYTSANLPSGASPQITSFTASSMNVSAGTSVTLSWQVSGASYVIVSPDAGAVRGTSVSLTPAATTTYTLYATNAFGQTKSTLTITVH